MLAALPPLLHLRRMEAAGDDRLGPLIQFALRGVKERRPGGRCALLRLSELLFVEVVRRYLATAPAERKGWLSGLRDPRIGCALALMHQRPAFVWTLAQLAREVGLSRSVLADRFTHYVGQPPMRYLACWRTQLAARLLAEETTKVSAVALEVGYDSEAAFSRAFKRIVGTAPAAWRRRALTAFPP